MVAINIKQTNKKNNKMYLLFFNSKTNKNVIFVYFL